MNGEQHLIVVRGLDGGERTHLARLLADALAGPAGADADVAVAHIQGDDLGRRWIVRGLPDQRQEVETVYRLLRLAVVSYLKDGFSVVVDAPFVAVVDGVYELRSRDLTDLVRLARTFRRITPGVVTLQSAPGAPRPLVDALASDEIEGEVRVVPNLAEDEHHAARAILDRLGM